MKTKPKFSKGDAVRTASNSGKVLAAAEFTDHLEYEVEFPDGTAAWISENNLQSAIRNPSTLNSQPSTDL